MGTVEGSLSDRTANSLFEFKNGTTVLVRVSDKAYAVMTFAMVLLKSSRAEMLA